MSELDNKLPNFIIGGAPRSGTTYLCHALARHPGIYIAKPYIPEPKVLLGPAKSKEEYIRDYTNLYRDSRKKTILGEKTSYYLENECALHRIEKLLPDVKMIFIVREPVSRAYSNYLWSRKNGLEKLTFEEAVEVEGKRVSPFPPEKNYVRPYDYLSRGDYALFAQRYYELLGRERVSFFLYEEIKINRKRLFNELQIFLGIEPLPIEIIDPQSIINSIGKNVEPINTETEKRLRLKMATKVKKFAEITGIDISPWGY